MLATSQTSHWNFPHFVTNALLEMFLALLTMGFFVTALLNVTAFRHTTFDPEFARLYFTDGEWGEKELC